MILESKTLFYTPLAADLYAVYVVDNTHQLYYLYEEQLGQFSKLRNPQEITRIALENLQKKIPSLYIHHSPLGISLHLDSEYESSMLLIYSLWQKHLQLPENPAIAITARDTVFIVDRQDKTAVSNLRKMAIGIYEKVPNAISAQLFTIHEGQLCAYNDCIST